jgi:hypothetical protein
MALGLCHTRPVQSFESLGSESVGFNLFRAGARCVPEGDSDGAAQAVDTQTVAKAAVAARLRRATRISPAAWAEVQWPYAASLPT